MNEAERQGALLVALRKLARAQRLYVRAFHRSPGQTPARARFVKIARAYRVAKLAAAA